MPYRTLIIDWFYCGSSTWFIRLLQYLFTLYTCCLHRRMFMVRYKVMCTQKFFFWTTVLEFISRTCVCLEIYLVYTPVLCLKKKNYLPQKWICGELYFESISYTPIKNHVFDVVWSKTKNVSCTRGKKETVLVYMYTVMGANSTIATFKFLPG